MSPFHDQASREERYFNSWLFNMWALSVKYEFYPGIYVGEAKEETLIKRQGMNTNNSRCNTLDLHNKHATESAKNTLWTILGDYNLTLKK